MNNYSIHMRCFTTINSYIDNLEQTTNRLACTLASANQELLTLEDGLQELRSYCELYSDKEGTLCSCRQEDEPEGLQECQLAEDPEEESFLKRLQQELNLKQPAFKGDETQHITDGEYFNYMMEKFDKEMTEKRQKHLDFIASLKDL